MLSLLPGKGQADKALPPPNQNPSPPSPHRSWPSPPKMACGAANEDSLTRGEDGGSPLPARAISLPLGRKVFPLSRFPAPLQAACFPRIRGGQTVYGAGWGPSDKGGDGGSPAGRGRRGPCKKQPCAPLLPRKGQTDEAAPPPHQSPAGGLLLCAHRPAQSIAPAGGEQAFPTFFPPAVCVYITPAKWGRLTPSKWQRRAFSPQNDIFYRACLRRIRTTKASISSPLVG